jgi:DivIVA domain-containing protein
MIDLTPLDVRKKRGDFRRLLRGYDPEEVDTFMDLVADRFEELVRENLSLKERTDRLEKQLEALEGRENAVQEALVTAQKLRAEVKEETRRDAEVVKDQASRSAELLKAEAEAEITRRLAEVDAEITRRLSEAERLIRERHFALEELERSRLKFLKSFRALLDREMDAVDVEEARRPLEETPLELEFRGWMPGASDGEVETVLEEEAAEVDLTPEVEEAAEADLIPEVEEAAEVDHLREVEDVAGFDDAAQLDVAPEADEGPAAVSPDEAEVDAPPEVEPEPTGSPTSVSAAWDAVTLPGSQEPADPFESGDEMDQSPSGFETQVLETGTLGSEVLDDEGDGEPDSGTVADDEDGDEIPKEPKWLFSLLKKEEEREGQP